PCSALPLGSTARLPRRLLLSRIDCRQVLEQADRRLALVLGFAHRQRLTSCMPITKMARKTLTL
ncbi:MAG: hypothetical protein ACK5YV_13675, partial [Betaproteobacteria bacterium]